MCAQLSVPSIGLPDPPVTSPNSGSLLALHDAALASLWASPRLCLPPTPPASGNSAGAPPLLPPLHSGHFALAGVPYGEPDSSATE